MHCLMKKVKMICGLINAVGALHIGSSALGYNIFSNPTVSAKIGWAMMYINYMFGVTGALFLVLSFVCCYSCSSCCASQGCGTCGLMGKN